MKRWQRVFGLGTIGVMAAAMVVPTMMSIAVVTPGTAFAADAEQTSAYLPVAPTRLADERDSSGLTVVDPLTFTVQIVGRAGIAEASAVAVTLTATAAEASGFVVAWATGTPRPTTSNLNLGRGETRANSAIVPVGADGTITVSTSAPAAVIVDVTGVFVPAESSTSGRFVPLAGSRLLDTRTSGALRPGAVVNVPLPPTVPADATSIVVTLTTSEGAVPGFLTAFPAGAGVPSSSTLNTDAAGQIRAVGAIVPVTAAGIDVLSSAGSSIIVDIAGYFTGASGADSADGLFVPIAPTRVLDTREQPAPIHRGGTVITPAFAGQAAVAMNLTITNTKGSGYLTSLPANTGIDPASVSSITSDRRNATVAAATIVAMSTDGVALTSSVTTHAIIDLFGYFTGSPTTATVVPPLGVDRNPKVAERPLSALLVGDSTMSGIRWYGDAQRALGGNVVYTHDLESCRRLYFLSCPGRENRLPPTTVEAIDALVAAGRRFDVVVVQTGYNDSPAAFGESFDHTVAAARRTGAEQIIWLNYRVGASYVNFQFNQTAGNGYGIINQILIDKLLTGSYPDVILADYDRYTRTADHWFVPDGVHFTATGSFGTADYISRYIAAVNNEPCPSAYAPGLPIEAVCSTPDSHPLVDSIGMSGGDPNALLCLEMGSDRRVVCRRDHHLDD